MPEVIQTVVYTFEELPESARETARDWYRALGSHHGWWDAIYEDFITICACLGIKIRLRNTTTTSGMPMTEPCVWFSGFSNQGDGACFEGSWRYARGAGLAIRVHAPNDDKLHDIVDRLQSIQQRNFYQLVADIEHQGRYQHEYCMHIAVARDAPNWQSATEDAEETVCRAMRDLARWLYRQLEAEYDFITSDDEIDAALVANAYTFTVSGRRFG